MTDRVISYIKSAKIVTVITFIIFLSASFDLVLNIRIGGFSLRIVYLFILILIAFQFLQSVVAGIFYVKFIGLYYYIVWFLFLCVFVNNTPLIGRNIGYLLWLFIHFLFIIFLYISSRQLGLVFFVKLYLSTYLVLIVAGLIQFFLALFGIDMFVGQWWINGFLARINGFSYEPSYYCTYIIIGFAIGYYIYRNSITGFGKIPTYIVWLGGTVILLSTSRMGILVAALQMLIFEILKNRRHLKKILVFSVSFFTFIFGIIWIVLNTEGLSFLMNGLGVNGGSAHSVVERLDGFTTQIDIFIKNPLKGYSLGGVSQAIAFEKGVTTMSQELMKDYDISMNVFMEVLIASGSIGFVFFLIYIAQNVTKLYKLAKQESVSIFNRHILLAFSWALVFELVILCFNQNILRAYFWIHIAALNTVYFMVRDQLSISEQSVSKLTH
jgi:hypothetical protein